VDPIELSIDLLAAYRLTRLATADIISEGPRRALVDSVGREAAETVDPRHERTAVAVVSEMEDPPPLARLVTCRWCAGVWIAGGVVLARAIAPRAWDPVAKALALSAGAALLAALEDG
jgi:Protein of unknown function (DUF1360)